MGIGEFYRKVTVAQANHVGIQGLSRILMGEVGMPVIVTDIKGRVLAWQSPPSVVLFPEEKIMLPSAVKNSDDIPGIGIISLKGKKLKYVCWPIGETKVLGYLLLIETCEQVSERALLPEFYEFAEIVGLSLMVEIMHQREMAEREKGYRDEFVRDLIFNNFDGIDEVIRSGKIWGCNFSGAHIVMVIAADFDTDSQEVDRIEVLSSIEKFFFDKTPGSIVGEMAHFQVAIIPLPEGELDDWHSYIRNLFVMLSAVVANSKINAGIGKVYENINMLYRSYQQAKVALELGKIVQHGDPPAFFDELGAVRLFYNQSEQDLNEFYTETVGILEKFDRENNSHFLMTLWYYLRDNRDMKTVSEKLFIHKNTLRYRLKKIEEVLGVNLDHEETRFNIYAALKVAAILGKVGYMEQS